MIIPKHWASAYLQERVGRRRLWVQRVGWSDVGPSEAEAHAQSRAREALARLRAGERVPRVEARVGYDGASGMPIREEIVSRHDEVVITRNSYGALCLNTPNVLFADVDFAQLEVPTPWVKRLALAVFVAMLVGAGGSLLSPMLGVALAFVIVGAAVHAASTPEPPPSDEATLEAIALARIEAFVKTRPDYHLRVYRTPAGLRVLAMHRTFDPCEPEVDALFEALRVDPVYARMCKSQRCFRARLTPKPWRIALDRRIPSDAPAYTQARAAWVAGYERASAGHAACRFVKALGEGRTNLVAQKVQRLHDEQARASRSLPLA